MTNQAQIEAKKPNAFVRFGKKVGAFFVGFGRKIKNYFASIGKAFVEGDIFTKLSFLITGFGYFFHVQHRSGISRLNEYGEASEKGEVVAYSKTVVQWLRGVFYLVIEALAVLALVFWGIPNFAKLSLANTGSVSIDQCEYDPAIDDFVCPQGENSFLIVLFSLLTILILIAFFFIHCSAIRGVHKAEKDIKEGHPIRSAIEDVKNLFDEHFYITSLFLPVLGVILFTAVPTLMMVLIAFTNFGNKTAEGANVTIDSFQWVGFSNWGSLFSLGEGSSFLKVFGSQLGWTLIWAFFATFTCFFGGLLLALLLNSKRTRFTKVWRTGFVITIAVPQFVSLMLIRYFLHDEGIVNNILASWGLPRVPFLSDPLTTKFTVIIVNCWVGFPYLMLMISGILMNIPADLYESARIDGAGKTRMFFSITMPYILQVCTPYLISSFVSNINNFNVIYLLTYDTPAASADYMSVVAKESDLLITWLYNMISDGAQPRYYMASIVGIMMFAISTLFTLITFTQSTKGNRERRLG